MMLQLNEDLTDYKKSLVNYNINNLTISNELNILLIGKYVSNNLLILT